MAVRFVGRESELGAVAAAMSAARSGQPRIVWIDGEPGIGKTAFLRRCLAMAADMDVVDAAGDESETALGYGVAAQLLARAQSGDPPPIIPGSRATPFLVGSELLGMLGSLQESAPVLVAVDDVHWIDPGSAGALLFALRRLRGDRVVVLLASRPDDLSHLGSSWARLRADDERVVRVRLPGLTAGEVSDLAGALGLPPLTRAAAERLREHTDGHPLHVKALLAEIPADTLNFGSGPLPAPRSYAATVLARLRTLSPDAQGLVSAAAVTGGRCRLPQAAAVAGVADPLAALEQALDAELLALEASRAPDEITFPHPLLRAAVRDDLSPARLRALHRAWSEQTTGTEALTHRAAASDGADDALAAELVATAESEVAAGQLAAGVERLLSASRVAEAPAARELALLRAVECLLLAGDVPAANIRHDDVVSCSDSPRRSFTIGALMASVGRVAEAAAAFRDVVSRSDFPRHPELEGPVASALALVEALLCNDGEAIGWARRALAAPGSSPAAAVTARQALVIGLTLSGRGDEAIAHLDDVSGVRVDPAPFEGELLATRGTTKVWWGDLAGAGDDLRAVLRWARAGVPVRSLPNAHSALAESEYRLGRWKAGVAHAEVAVVLGEDTHRSWDLPYLHAVAAHLDAGRGAFPAAEAHVAAARRAAEETPLALCEYHAREAAGHLAWVRTEWEAVLDALGPLLANPVARRSGAMVHRAVQLMRAEALVATGRLDDAEAALADVAFPAGALAGDVTSGERWRVAGELARARGRRHEAEAAFAAAATAAAAAGSPFYSALVTLSRGRLLRQTGARRDAIAAVRSARRGFEQLAARPFVGRCDAELTACGVRPPGPKGVDSYGLTAREAVVARLVASGKTNREVAAELFLSTKAIEYHLSNVFAKVNVRSRHELAVRLNATGDP